MVVSPDRFTIAPDGAVARLDPTVEFSSRALAALVAQEVGGLTRSVTDARVRELLARFGFSFEPWAEPGHLRMQPMAARMHDAAERHARLSVLEFATGSELAYDEVSGVVVIDTASAGLAAYLKLIHADPSLYGAEPYALAGARTGLILRPTSCLQKFSIAAEWDWESTDLPRCLFEISDSFRGEPDDAVEELFRVRRFRLPEAHLHHRGLAAALDTARELNAFLTESMRELEAEFAILVSVSHDTWTRHEKAIAAMVADSETSALALVSPPGALCQDGIELDFEYKFLDTHGFPRELATFQLDTLVTSAIGLSAVAGELTTTHLVPTGSVERLIYAHLDRVARHERRGVRAVLPAWLAPISFRFLDAPPGSDDAMAAVCGEATRLGLLFEIDDRPFTLAAKVADADDQLVPFTVRSVGGGQPDRLLVRSYRDGEFQEWDSATWFDTLAPYRTSLAGPLGSSPRLSRRPVQQPRQNAGRDERGAN